MKNLSTLKGLLSRAPPCFGRHIKTAAFAVDSPLLSRRVDVRQAVGLKNNCRNFIVLLIAGCICSHYHPPIRTVVGYGLFSLCLIHKEGLLKCRVVCFFIVRLVWCPGQNKRKAPLSFHGYRKRLLRD
jgi:hypothetical protein